MPSTLGDDLVAFFVFIVIIAFIVIGIWYSMEYNHKVAVTKSVVARIANDLDVKCDHKTGLFIHENVEELDGWSIPIHITYRENINSELLEIRSAGYDGLLFNEDDIVVTKERFRLGSA